MAITGAWCICIYILVYIYIYIIETGIILQHQIMNICSTIKLGKDLILVYLKAYSVSLIRPLAIKTSF